MKRDVQREQRTPALESPWRALLRLRWPVAGAIALAFALGRALELLFLRLRDPTDVALDVIVWGLLGGLAVWLSLTWVIRRERRYQANIEQALVEQQALNGQLQRANRHLSLLSEANRRLAASASLDAILDAALEFPLRLLEVRAAVLMLHSPVGPVAARTSGDAALVHLRPAFALAPPPDTQIHAQVHTIAEPVAGVSLCLVLPLHDRVAPLGWLELYLERSDPLATDELSLLETIAAECAEAIEGTRRRTREERAIYQLEQAIVDERARIARDVHDGIAQNLAFLRMRVDLWQDWITSDPVRLREELGGLKQSLREQIGDLRRAIFALRPLQFDELGFTGGLHRYIIEFAGQHEWDVQVNLEGLPHELAPELEAITFRVIQEALTNAAKHAAARSVQVTVGCADAGLLITVRDDGRGFDPGRLDELPADHVGLRQMQERMEVFRGRLTILSRKGAGTELRAWIPLGGAVAGTS